MEPTRTPQTSDGLDLVTVTFRGEDTLQRVQARSIARNVEPGTFGRILVVDNDSRPLSARRVDKLRRLYGPHEDRVEVMPRSAVADIPDVRGRISQQILKLRVAELVTAPWYVLLDSKNHVIRRTDRSDFIGDDARAHGGTHGYEGHPHQKRLQHVLDYLGLPDAMQQDFPPTTMPVVMRTDVVREILRDLAPAGSGSFEDEFVRADLSEFFLYAGWLARHHGGWEHLYGPAPIQSAVVWRGKWRQAIASAEELDAPFFAVHRGTLARLSRDAGRAVAQFWVDRGLFATASEARAVIRRGKVDAAVSKLLRR